jgi:hypothetical protein
MYIIIFLIAIFVNIILSVKFSEIADEKGYNGKNYFWLCFFLGSIGFIMVAALPDLTLRYYLNQFQSNSTQQPIKNQSNTPMTERSAPPPQGSWVCTCGQVNANYVSSCSCGVNKRDVAK